MFNRSLQVKMVKDSKKDDKPATDDNFLKGIMYAHEATRSLLKEAVKIVAVYVVLDTTRQVLVAYANK